MKSGRVDQLASARALHRGVGGGQRIMTTSQRTGTILAAIGGGMLLARAFRAGKAIDFAGMTIVITGGSRGLGLVIARELASEGAHVVLMARDAEELERARADIESRGGDASAFVCDIRNRDDVNHTIERIVGHFGSIDVLINDAGIIQAGPLSHGGR